MRELLFMEPVLRRPSGGGTRLKDVFGYDIPSSHIRRVLGYQPYYKNGDCRVQAEHGKDRA